MINEAKVVKFACRLCFFCHFWKCRLISAPESSVVVGRGLLNRRETKRFVLHVNGVRRYSSDAIPEFQGLWCERLTAREAMGNLPHRFVLFFRICHLNCHLNKVDGGNRAILVNIDFLKDKLWVVSNMSLVDGSNTLARRAPCGGEIDDKGLRISLRRRFDQSLVLGHGADIHISVWLNHF